MVNRALHSIAAHLHRYGSELSAAAEILNDIQEHHDSYVQQRQQQQGEDEEQGRIQQNCRRVSRCLRQICSHMQQVRVLLQELEVKLKNILALVRVP